LIPLRVREPQAFVGRGHFQHEDKSAGLIRAMKVCPQEREELEAWARARRVRAHRL
jgi:hypothetical protein